ncbi:phosphoribosyl-AMP cyclohydrolase [Corynebacterium kalinowskii]|uniref:Phosphoribosyl-AMP cyclohydrolase n=1 Tax=Corynebacterium kalinowskii TaxID=2675216 RepID=A0A6B8VB16_9CORY|nr:phosphoribosyl-AMP cyclohydrolase [Corynebacterium kalinowskii]QGU02332.1 phosphoribosyl-AMP cyclohydrolase [Corynebacterium kalinowskii]
MTNPAEFVLDKDIESSLKFNDAGLIPVIVQAEGTKEVLMMAWMDSHALAHSLATRQGTYFSRSRNSYWIKGETSGHVQEVVSVAADCDGDTLLMVVRQTGAACHTGSRTCFDGRELPCAN